MRSNLAGPRVAALLARNGQSHRWAAQRVGISGNLLSARLRGDLPMHIAHLVDVARVAHATEAELEEIAMLDAVDHGALPLDEQTTIEEIRAMRDALTRLRRKKQAQEHP